MVHFASVTLFLTQELPMRNIVISFLAVALTACGDKDKPAPGGPDEVKSDARIAAAKLTLDGVGLALETLEVHLNRFPTTDEGLNTLLFQPADAAGERWRGPYIQGKDLKDPWGNEVHYKLLDESSFELTSAGPDGKVGTGDDIVFKGP